MSTNHDILLVDDDRDIRDSLTIILEGNGYAVRTARNGHEALAALQERKPGLMILDVMMSTDTEGFDFAYELRSMPQFQDVPIVMLTSFLDKVRNEGPAEYQHILGQDWPAAWLFEKPVDSAKLLQKLAEVLKT